MLIEILLRKQLKLKAHTVTKVEETERYMIIHIDRKGVACSVAGSVGSDAEGFKAPVWTKISHGKKFDYGDDLRHKLPAR